PYAPTADIRSPATSTAVRICRTEGHEGVLPWFAEASDPDTIVTSRAADYTNDPVAIVEWLASRNRLDLVDGYGRRSSARHPGTGDRRDRGAAAARNGDPNPNNGDLVMSMGWAIAALTSR
ncbi:hypothetical protein, partial [Micromonospora sp. CPCC 206061]|uniref:hypothetical protein n=1 Tax=Micromonospora sp. CPCC 206061 TaxID=3122410 RepID=UPI002FF0750B